MTALDHTMRKGAAPALADTPSALPSPSGGRHTSTGGHPTSSPTSSEHAARNRRLGWTLFGLFAALAAFSVVFIFLRSVGR